MMGKPMKDFLFFFLLRGMINIVSERLLQPLYTFSITPTDGRMEEMILIRATHGSEAILNF